MVNKRYLKYKKSYGEYRKKNRARLRIQNLKNSLRRWDEIEFGGNRLKVLERDNWQCRNCGMTNEQHIIIFGRGITVDHIDGNGRYSKIKNNNLQNLQTLCLRCHGKKDRNRGGK